MGCLYTPSLDICPLGVFYILINVGLSALLVSTNWAMLEPYYVERASGLAPRLNRNKIYTLLIISETITGTI